MRYPILNNVDGLILDMDGVLYRGDQPIGDLEWIFRRMDEIRKPYILATNNATRSPEDVAEKLSKMGARVDPSRIINSGMAVAELLKQRFPKGSRVFILGEIGLHQAIEAAGFTVSDSDPAAVVVGLDRQLTYQKLTLAMRFIRGGSFFIATNPDKTFPAPDGLLPGAGTVIAAVAAASETEPVYAGKPYPGLYDTAIAALGMPPDRVLAVGDRLDTDILGGINAGCKTALVLTGVSQRADLASLSYQPDIVADSLQDLLDE